MTMRWKDCNAAVVQMANMCTCYVLGASSDIITNCHQHESDLRFCLERRSLFGHVLACRHLFVDDDGAAHEPLHGAGRLRGLRLALYPDDGYRPHLRVPDGTSSLWLGLAAAEGFGHGDEVLHFVLFVLEESLESCVVFYTNPREFIIIKMF